MKSFRDYQEKASQAISEELLYLWKFKTLLGKIIYNI